eukprot:TRINITY_DN12904_c0_g1_i1.p1 TRINITY_DN12904_c0_g1~~TRINITY_DN12904_c0_g1_i1.p1  ORF type:complete len:567 (+),score=143.22 TRINITY_DN12904_c0_g1_i1:164-1702(+)
MHIDNHGGTCNGFAVDRETILVASPTTEQEVVLANGNPQFVPHVIRFDIESNSCDSKEAGWGKYVNGALLSLKEHFSEKKENPSLVGWSELKGFKGYVMGDIPTGAAAASSHTFVLAVTLAALASIKYHHRSPSNNSPLSAPPLVDLVLLGRRAEGKAGAVTGLADQGLMVFSRPGCIASSSFYQGDVDAIRPQYARFPPSSDGSKKAVVVMVDSLMRRSLAGAEAKNYAIPRFAYSVSLGLLKEAMKRSKKYDEHFIEKIDRLSRVSPVFFGSAFVEDGVNEKRKLNIGTKQIYELLKMIPEKETITNLESLFPSLVPLFANAKQAYLSKMNVDASEELALRGALLFGISECARADLFIKLLLDYEVTKGDDVALLTQLGELMNVGHDGDKRDESRRIDDAYLDSLIERIDGDEKSNESAQLWRQPGDFRASIKELDDIQAILSRHGFGACLTGAGLGGVVIALVPPSNLALIKNELWEHFRKERQVTTIEKEDVLQVVCPVAGTGFVSVS